MSEESAEAFLRVLCLPPDATGETAKYLSSLARHHLDDFSSSHAGYFSLQAQAAITDMAAQKLVRHLAVQNPADFTHLSVTEIQKHWADVVRDFHENNNWGFSTQAKPEKVIKPPTPYRIGAKYFFAFFNSIVVIKTAILFIGAEAAENPDPKFKYLLWGAIVFSFLNLFWFAFSTYRSEKKHNQSSSM